MSNAWYVGAIAWKPPSGCCGEGDLEWGHGNGGTAFVQAVNSNECSGILTQDQNQGEGVLWWGITNMPSGNWRLTFPTTAEWMNPMRVYFIDSDGSTVLSLHEHDPSTFERIYTITDPGQILRFYAYEHGFEVETEAGTWSLCPTLDEQPGEG